MKKMAFPSLLLRAALAGAALAGSASAERLVVEDEAVVVVNRLAASIATAQSTDEIDKLVLDAKQAGLTDEQIAFAFGIANELASTGELIAQAYATFLAAVSVEDQSGEQVVEPLTAAFVSGSQAVSAQQSDTAFSRSGNFFQSSPLGSTGFQGGGLGGGGSSPK